MTIAFRFPIFVKKSLKLCFVKQEEILVQDFIFDPRVNLIGSALLPVYNELLSLLETFEYSEPSFQTGQDFYPGMEECAWDPHAKWHLQTSIALTDFIFLADQHHRIFSQINEKTF